MWLRDPITIEIASNTVVPIGFQFFDDATNERMPLDGISFACNIATADGNTSVAQYPVEVSDATLGEIDINFDGGVLNGSGSQATRLFSGQLIAYQFGQSITAARFVIILVPGIN